MFFLLWKQFIRKNCIHMLSYSLVQPSLHIVWIYHIYMQSKTTFLHSYHHQKWFCSQKNWNWNNRYFILETCFWTFSWFHRHNQSLDEPTRLYRRHQNFEIYFAESFRNTYQHIKILKYLLLKISEILNNVILKQRSSNRDLVHRNCSDPWLQILLTLG